MADQPTVEETAEEATGEAGAEAVGEAAGPSAGTAAEGAVGEGDAGRAAFLPVFEVGPSHLAQAQALAGHFRQALAPRPADTDATGGGAGADADFGRISRAAAAVAHGGAVRTVRGWGLRETAPVGVMVLSLREVVRQALPAPSANAGFWRKVERALTDVFVGLGGQRGARPSRADGADGGTGYRCHLLFALQDEETGDAVHAVALRLDATIGLDGPAARALTVDDVAPFALRVDAVAVRQQLPAAV
ncbi:Type-2Aa cytolytic delta-endotoxin [Streptomyces sp. DH12]|uniref:Type-2Aa cytolytic delta-endotoxin n=1 Tax=Streptomyces sp. DH12 TaxID=2857010 RepID=UPI001E58AEDF|nr:Type-2Aa cytolytic delta-endotoxin [Streptomyces sp. DH12]